MGKEIEGNRTEFRSITAFLEFAIENKIKLYRRGFTNDYYFKFDGKIYTTHESFWNSNIIMQKANKSQVAGYNHLKNAAKRAEMMEEADIYTY